MWHISQQEEGLETQEAVSNPIVSSNQELAEKSVNFSENSQEHSQASGVKINKSDNLPRKLKDLHNGSVASEVLAVFERNENEMLTVSYISLSVSQARQQLQEDLNNSSESIEKLPEVTDNAIRKALARWLKEGYIEKVKWGHYQLKAKRVDHNRLNLNTKSSEEK